MSDMREPFTNAYDGLRNIVEWLFPAASEDAMLALIDVINTVLNASIGLIITLAVVAFFIHLIRWIFAGENEMRADSAVKGTTRAIVALFLMVNIWFIIRLINAVTELSPIAAYAIFVLSFIFFAAWSLCNIGDGFIRLIVQGGNGLLDVITRRVRAWQARAPEKHLYLAHTSDRTLRVISLGLIFLVVSPLALIGPISSDAPSESAPLSTESSVWQPLLYTDADVGVNGSTYENRKYGFSVAFPEGWSLTTEGTLYTLIEASDATTTARVSGVSYVGPEDYSGESDYYIVATIMDNYLRNYLEEGWSVTSMEPVQEQVLVGDTTGDLYIVGLWDGSINLVAFFVVFRHDSAHYTLEVFHPNEERVYEHVLPIMQSILDSIQFK